MNPCVQQTVPDYPQALLPRCNPGNNQARLCIRKAISALNVSKALIAGCETSLIRLKKMFMSLAEMMEAA